GHHQEADAAAEIAAVDGDEELHDPRGPRDRRPSRSFGTLRKKLPQANSAVANRTSQMRANTAAGVAKRMTAPSAPPTRLITNSVRIVRPGGVPAPARPVKPLTSCAGNSATVEVMLAARASMPVSISDGKRQGDERAAAALAPVIEKTAARPSSRHSTNQAKSLV